MRLSVSLLTLGSIAFVQISYALPTLPSSLSSRAGTVNNSTVERQRADAVKAAFQFAWDGYYKYCFGHDELHPVSNTCGDSRYYPHLLRDYIQTNLDRNGWGASAVDALSTALVMQCAPTVNEILQYIPTIDFSKTNEQVSLFETTIRYVAGMLSGYDLLKGPLANLPNNVRNIPRQTSSHY